MANDRKRPAGGEWRCSVQRPISGEAVPRSPPRQHPQGAVACRTARCRMAGARNHGSATATRRRGPSSPGLPSASSGSARRRLPPPARDDPRTTCDHGEANLALPPATASLRRDGRAPRRPGGAWWRGSIRIPWCRISPDRAAPGRASREPTVTARAAGRHRAARRCSGGGTNISTGIPAMIRLIGRDRSSFRGGPRRGRAPTPPYRRLHRRSPHACPH